MKDALQPARFDTNLGCPFEAGLQGDWALGVMCGSGVVHGAEAKTDMDVLVA